MGSSSRCGEEEEATDPPAILTLAPSAGSLNVTSVTGGSATATQRHPHSSLSCAVSPSEQYLFQISEARMEGEESRLRYVDSQVKTAPASTWVVVPTAHHPSPICAATTNHDMTSHMFVMLPVHDCMNLVISLS